MKNIRKDFPILNSKINGQNLVYFDNAATTQKPQQVIDSITNFYSKNNATVHRGVYSFAEDATIIYEEARKKVATFLNAQPDEIVFTHGATAGINIVALSWAEKHITQDDEIIISELEHHSNLIPWQQLAKKKCAKLLVIPINENFELNLNVYKTLLSKKTKLVAISHVSNVLGTNNDIEFITKKAHEVGAKVLIDAAQSVAHQKIDVLKIGCDFLIFSGHKLLGPTGIGVLFIKKSIHHDIQPFFYGGGMVFETEFEKTTFKKVPYMLEVGTPAIEQAVGLSSAIDYIEQNIDFQKLREHEANLCHKLIQELLKFPLIKILGPIDQLSKMGHIVTFTIDGIHPHDVASYLDTFGICVRAGHHCAQQLHKTLGVDSSIRVSFFAYNTQQEVDFFIEVLKKLI